MGVVTLINNIISNNFSDIDGGGIDIIDSDTVYLTNNTIYGNSALEGEGTGGLYLELLNDGAIAYIYNNIFWNNDIGTAFDEFTEDLCIINSNFSTVNLFNNDFDQSAQGTYIENPFSIDFSNLNNADPLFIDPDNGDFHLSKDSPCINAGDNNAPELPSTDLDGEPRILDSEIDMGADEYYDGNDDSIVDILQDNVASTLTNNGQDYITMESPVGTSINNFIAADNPSTTDSPSKTRFPYGFFEFTITGIGIGGGTTVIMHFPVGAQFNTYYKYGQTPDNDIDHWYKFSNDGQTGAEINGNVIILDFLDGQRGDDDLTADGIVSDIGGPAKLSNGGGDCPCFIGTAVNSFQW